MAPSKPCRQNEQARPDASSGFCRRFACKHRLGGLDDTFAGMSSRWLYQPYKPAEVALLAPMLVRA